MGVMVNQQDTNRLGFIPGSFILAFAKQLKGGVRKYFAKGKFLFEEGDIAQGLYYIEKGEVKLSIHAGTEMEQVIKIVNAGEIIGFNALLQKNKYPYSASVILDTTLIFIPQDDFKEILGNDEKGIIECHKTPFFSFLKSGALNITIGYIIEKFPWWGKLLKVNYCIP